MTVDFTKTSAQVGREIEQEIETLQRQLMVSRGHGEKGASAVLNVVLVGVVLAGQFAISLLFEKHEPAKDKVAITSHLTDRDRTLVEDQLTGIERQVDKIRATKTTVAPSMAIEGNMEAITTASKHLRRVLGIDGSGESTKPQ